MNKTEHIATTRRVVAGDRGSKSKPPPSTAVKKDNGEEEDAFLKKITKWSDRDRSGWKWSQRPSHRNKTIGAALSQGALLSKNASDVSALQDVEQSLSAMGAYIAEGNQEDRCLAEEVAQNSSSVSDCLHIREMSKLKAKEGLARAAKENRPKGPMFHVDDAPHSPGVYRPIKPFDPDNLESVRRHNTFRQKQIDDMKKDMDSEKKMHNFHALPMPGHVPYVDRDQKDGASPHEADALVAFVAEQEATDRRTEKKRSTEKKNPTVPAAAEDFKAFFVTEGDNADSEASKSEESTDESNDDDIDAELAELTKKEKEILSSYTKLSRQRDRAAQAVDVRNQFGGDSVRDPFSTPRQMSADIKATPRLHTPGSTPRRRPTSTDVLMRETAGGSGPSILDLDQKEREVLFKLKKEQKVRELKHELEVQNTKDLQRAPNITKAQESWRKAKEEHNRESLRQLQHEEMKQKLADMQEEMRIMRLEQKVNELRKVGDRKVLKERLRGMVQAGLSQSTTGSSVKSKKVKRKRRTSSRDKTPVKGSASELSNNASVFIEGADMDPQSSLAEESSLLGLTTNSLLEHDGPSSISTAPSGAKKGASKKSGRNHLPPRGPNLSYSQFEAQEPIREEDEDDDSVDGRRNGKSNREKVQQSALDLLSEDPSCVDDSCGNKDPESQQRSFVSRSGRRRHRSPSLSYAEQSDARCDQGSTITYESETDLVKESPNGNLEEGMSMFSVGGNNNSGTAEESRHPGRHSGARGSRGTAGETSRDSTPMRSKPGNKDSTPSPYGVDLAAAYDSRYHHHTSLKVSRRKESGGSVQRKDEVHRGHSEHTRGIAAGYRSEQCQENHYVSSPTRSKPKLRDYSSPHRNLFDVDDEIAKSTRPTSSRAGRGDSACDDTSPVGPPTVGNRPGWSDAEPEIMVNNSNAAYEENDGRLSGALSVRRSDVSRGVRSSRASTDLYLSDSESIISYDRSGNPQTLSPGTKPEKDTRKSFGLHYSGVSNELTTHPTSASEKHVVKDPRYRHIDVYQSNGGVGDKNVSQVYDNRANTGYTFVPRPSSSSKREGLSSATGNSRPNSSQKALDQETVCPPPAVAPATPSSAVDRGDVGERFFDSSSTQDKGRFRVKDARDFHTKSMHRRPDTLDEGVTLLLGVRRTMNTGASGGGLAPGGSLAGGDLLAGDEEVITVLFDRAQFSEERARAWWQMNKERILNISKFQ